MKKLNKEILQSERGAISMEYCFMALLIAVCCVMGVANLGTVVNDSMGDCKLKNPVSLGGHAPGC